MLDRSKIIKEVKKYLDKTKILKYIYTSLIVIISFMIFNTETTTDIFTNLKNMFFINNIPLLGKETIYYFRSYIIIFIIACISATPILKNTITKLNKTKVKRVIDIIEPLLYIILLTLCTAYLIDASFNPFLYFRF